MYLLAYHLFIPKMAQISKDRNNTCNDSKQDTTFLVKI